MTASCAAYLLTPARTRAPTLAYGAQPLSRSWAVVSLVSHLLTAAVVVGGHEGHLGDGERLLLAAHLGWWMAGREAGGEG